MTSCKVRKTLQDPKLNERLSAKRFKEDFAAMLNNVCTVAALNDKKNSSPQKLPLTWQEDLLKTSKELADLVIIDGTYFMFADKKTKAHKDFLEGKTINDSPTITLAMLTISLNDTSRMLTIETMLNDPTYSSVFRRQMRILRDNSIIRMFLAKRTPGLLSKKAPGDFYKATRSSLVPVVSDQKIAPLLSFIQLFGQNLRVACEFDQKSPVAKAFRTYINKGILPDYNGYSIADAFQLVIDKMDAELREKGFCEGMQWTEKGIEHMNTQFIHQFGERFKLGFGFSIFKSPYKEAWREYIQNARDVIATIKKTAESITDPQEKTKFQQEIVMASLEIARNQAGLFLKKKLLSASPSPSPSPVGYGDRKRLRSSNL